MCPTATEFGENLIITVWKPARVSVRPTDGNFSVELLIFVMFMCPLSIDGFSLFDLGVLNVCNIHIPTGRVFTLINMHRFRACVSGHNV